MKRTSLAHLVHPDSGAPLALEATRTDGDDVLEGALKTDAERYAIRQGVPSFVSEEVAGDQTVKSFGEKWDKHRYYRAHTAPFYTDWYLARYGLGDLDGLKAFLADKLFILDAGTGAGRDAANFAAHSQGTVYGIDTSWAALTNFREQPEAARVNLIHADVNRLPFPDEFFDFINCDQVIHHTPDPPTTFRNLRRKLKCGGEVTCYVYKKKAHIREWVDDHVRDQVSHMSFEQAMEAMSGITKLGKALADLKATIEIDEDIEVLGIEKGRYDVQRFIHWNVMKCFWNDDFDFFTNNVVNVDWYHPLYCFRYTPEQFRAWFDEGWEILAWDVQDAGVSCRARKI